MLSRSLFSCIIPQYASLSTLIRSPLSLRDAQGRDDEAPRYLTRHDNNHLGDCEKYQLIIPTLIESQVGKNGLKILADRIASKLALAS
jgi:hypothetical protein